MSYQWKITKDCLPVKDAPEGTNLNATGLCGPATYDELREHEMTAQFRMKDDDGEIYYEGIATPEADFGPLDDFGMPNAGCTNIEYKEKGIWKVL